MKSSKMYCPIRCRYRTDQFGVRNYPISWEVVYSPEWKYAKVRAYQSPWYRVCTKAMVISKGSYVHGEFKMSCHSLCRYRTYHCVAAKYPVSWGVVQGTEWKYAKLRPYQSPWYRVCTKELVISKGSYGHGDFKNVLPQSVQKPYLQLRGSKVPRFIWGQYRAQNENMRTFSHTNSHGIVFAPKQWLYEKEATSMDSSKMYYPRRCRYRTDQFGARKYPVSWGVVQDTEWKYAKLQPYQFPWYRVYTKAMIISKGSYGHGEFKIVSPQSVQIPYLPLCGSKVPRLMGGQYRAQNVNMRNFGPTNPHGTAFAPKQQLYQKEVTGMESPKMYFPSRCRYRTYHCVEAKYPVSWMVVQGPEWKYSKLRPYQFPWHRVCTKAMVILKGSYGHGELKIVLRQSVQIP